MVNNGGPLSIAALYDVNGNSLTVDADDAIQRVEDFFQAHIERTGDAPEKGAKIIVEIEILATGPSGRTIDWKVDTKYPSTATTRSQQSASVDGIIYPMAQPKQYRMELQRDQEQAAQKIKQ